ncbi:MAG: hypothetical protein ABJA79_03320 [Parafilimonas sp.]
MASHLHKFYPSILCFAFGSIIGANGFEDLSEEQLQDLDASIEEAEEAKDFISLDEFKQCAAQ